MEVKTIDNFNIHENPPQNQDSFDVENYLNTNFEKIQTVTNNNAEILKQLQEENEELKNQIPSANVSGNSIHIEDSSDLEFDWKIRGGHKQEVREQKLKTYKNITNINLSDELASIDVEYKKDIETMNKNIENRLAELESALIS